MSRLPELKRDEMSPEESGDPGFGYWLPSGMGGPMGALMYAPEFSGGWPLPRTICGSRPSPGSRSRAWRFCHRTRGPLAMPGLITRIAPPRTARGPSCRDPARPRKPSRPAMPRATHACVHRAIAATDSHVPARSSTIERSRSLVEKQLAETVVLLATAIIHPGSTTPAL